MIDEKFGSARKKSRARWYKQENFVYYFYKDEMASALEMGYFIFQNKKQNGFILNFCQTWLNDDVVRIKHCNI